MNKSIKEMRRYLETKGFTKEVKVADHIKRIYSEFLGEEVNPEEELQEKINKLLLKRVIVLQRDGRNKLLFWESTVEKPYTMRGIKLRNKIYPVGRIEYVSVNQRIVILKKGEYNG